jgi:hypothetical protein
VNASLSNANKNCYCLGYCDKRAFKITYKLIPPFSRCIIMPIASQGGPTGQQRA